MADVPHEAPHNIAKGGLTNLKKLPPWALVVVIGGGLLLVIMMRHNAAQKKASTVDPTSTDQSATVDPNTDPNSQVGYTDPYANNTLDPPTYIDPNGGQGGFISAGANGVLPSPVGPAVPGPTSNTFSPSIVNSPVVTGGGAPARPSSTAHGTPAPAKPATPRYRWDNKTHKWVIGTSGGYHYDTKTKKWVKGK